MLGPDGTHYTPAGYERLAEAVADCVLRQLTIARYRPLPRPAAGPQAAAEYRKAAAERDAQVPDAYRRLAVGEFRIPEDADAWKERRPSVLEAVVESLGDLPPRPAPPRARIISPRAPAGLHAGEGRHRQRRRRRGHGAAADPGQAGRGRRRRSSGCTRRRPTRRRSSSPTPTAARSRWARRS